MSGASRYTRAISANVEEIERRLRMLEQNLEDLGTRASANARDTADGLSDTIAATLAGLADRIRRSAGSVGDQSAAFSKDAAKYGGVALRRISNEVGHRPLLTLAIAVGVGVLIGVTSKKR
jgi:ElaB/YqjD/DUF883 family membrane-anchored ribosome-binding protein